MDINALQTDILTKCNEINHFAVEVHGAWNEAVGLHAQWKQGTFCSERLIQDLRRKKSGTQYLLGAMGQNMLNVHLLVSGALAALPTHKEQALFLQEVLTPLMEAQMVGNTADNLATGLGDMLAEVVKATSGT